MRVLKLVAALSILVAFIGVVAIAGWSQIHAYMARPGPAEEETVVGVQHKLLFVLKLLQDADARPTTQALEAVERLEATLAAVQARWDALR